MKLYKCKVKYWFYMDNFIVIWRLFPIIMLLYVFKILSIIIGLMSKGSSYNSTIIRLYACHITIMIQHIAIFYFLRLSTLLISSFDTTHFFLVIISVISLSLNLFQVSSQLSYCFSFLNILLMLIFHKIINI
jgi:hypothetical protein